jgi:8-oxo-dGTP pyrophosphatase MutT (NUDIX family)
MSIQVTNAQEPQIENIDAIDYRLEALPWRFAIDEATAIDRHWHKLREEKPRLYNGRVLLMHRSALVGGASARMLKGACFEAQYKAFLAWRDFGFPDPNIRNCFAMPALRSADGAFILGQMAAFTASPGRIYFPAGTPEPADVKDGIVDLEGNMLRELTEETGIAAADVTLGQGWTLVIAGPRIACMKLVQSNLPAAAIVARVTDFLGGESEPELARVIAVTSRDDLDPEHMPDFTLAYLRHVLA